MMTATAARQLKEWLETSRRDGWLTSWLCAWHCIGFRAFYDAQGMDRFPYWQLWYWQTLETAKRSWANEHQRQG